MIARRTLQLMILAILATTIIIGGFFIGKWYLGGPLTIDVSGIDMNQSKLFVNNQLYNLYGYNEKDKTFLIPDVYGEQTVRIHSAGLKVYEQKISVFTRNGKQLKPEPEPLAAKEAAAHAAAAMGWDSTARIDSAEYKTNTETGSISLLFTITADGKQMNRTVVFDAVNNAWTEGDND